MQVVTFYPGASSDVVASGVTAPLERQLGEVPGLNQMISTSSEGASVITLQFVLSLNIDVAEQEVQAAINAAQTFLPANLPLPPVYSKTNPADAPILTLALTSTSIPLSKVEDLADTHLAQKISQLPGGWRRDHQRRPEARGSDSGQPDTGGVLRTEPRRSPHRADDYQPRCRQGKLRRTQAGVSDRRERPVDYGQRLSERGCRLQERRARDAQGRRPGSSTGSRTCARPRG